MQVLRRLGGLSTPANSAYDHNQFFNVSLIIRRRPVACQRFCKIITGLNSFNKTFAMTNRLLTRAIVPAGGVFHHGTARAWQEREDCDLAPYQKYHLLGCRSAAYCGSVYTVRVCNKLIHCMQSLQLHAVIRPRRADCVAVLFNGRPLSAKWNDPTVKQLLHFIALDCVCSIHCLSIRVALRSMKGICK